METARQPAALKSEPKSQTPDAEASPPARKRKPFVVLGVIAAIALVGVGAYTMMTRGRETTDDAQITADMVPVSARVSGVVARVLVHENQAVKKGAPLIEIDAADLLAKQQQAEAELATAQAQAQAAEAQEQIVSATSKGGLASAKAALSGSAAGVGTAEAQLASAKAAAVHADADLQKAQIDFQRAETLRKADAVPQQQLDTARLGLDAARASKAQADAQVALAMDARVSAQSRVGEARGRVDQSAPVAPQIAAAHAGSALAEARVRSAQAALALATLQVGYTRIVAPADGWASKLTVHEGQLVAVGQPLVELVPSDTYLVASFKETQIGKMRPGQPAEISVDAFPGRTLVGKIESLAGGTGSSFSLLPPDNSTGNFVKVVQRVPVRISLVDPPPEVVLRPGLSADVTVDTR
jgi:membrane fusion protein (multidrug efflux system)